MTFTSVKNYFFICMKDNDKRFVDNTNINNDFYPKNNFHIESVVFFISFLYSTMFTH